MEAEEALAELTNQAHPSAPPAGAKPQMHGSLPPQTLPPETQAGATQAGVTQTQGAFMSTQQEQELLNMPWSEPNDAPPADPTEGAPGAPAAAAAAGARPPETHASRELTDEFTVEVTGPDGGARVFCREQVAEDAPAAEQAGRLRAALRERAEASGLLSRPIEALMGDVEAAAVERAKELTRREAAGAAGGGEAPAACADAPGAGPGHRLWVDKFAPSKYGELLSEEGVNREVLAWLRSWDACVFHRKVGDEVLKLGAGVTRHDFHLSEFRKGLQARRAGEVTDADWRLGPDRRPRHKVVLISGPPGLGKTTLAHVAATLCGYRVVEVNASDDRSAGKLEARVQDAAGNMSVTADKRPVCVVVDEIDGALGGEGTGAVEALLRLVAGEGGGRRGGGDGEEPAAPGTPHKTPHKTPRKTPHKTPRKGGRGGGGGGGGGGLRRPVICICNDPSAPALVKLKQVARVFHLDRPATQAVVGRLQEVARREGLSAEGRALHALCDKTGSDIRSCLNTMQFLHRQGKRLTLADVRGMSFGSKDMAKGAFQVWDDLFHLPTDGGGGGRSAGGLYSGLQSFGDLGAVMAGCFENASHVARSDASLDRRALPAALALSEAAAASGRAYARGAFEQLAYVPGLLLQFRGAMASPARHYLQWPRVDGDSTRRTGATRALLRGWMAGVRAGARASLGERTAACELVPALMWALAPAVRPVQGDLLTEAERGALADTVDTMIALGLQYDPGAHPVPRALGEKRAPGEDEHQALLRGSTPLALSPALDTLHSYDGRPISGRPLPASVRQVITRAAAEEAARRVADLSLADAADGAPLSPRTPARAPGSGPRGGALSVSRGVTGRVITTLEERMASVAGPGPAVEARRGTWLDQLRGDGAKRSRTGGVTRGRDPVTKRARAEGAGDRDHAVRFRHNEGLTNAIRRSVRMGDLLLGL